MMRNAIWQPWPTGDALRAILRGCTIDELETLNTKLRDRLKATDRELVCRGVMVRE